MHRCSWNGAGWVRAHWVLIVVVVVVVVLGEASCGGGLEFLFFFLGFMALFGFVDAYFEEFD